MAVEAHPSRRARDDSTRPARHAVYVWELPVRIVHWTVVISLIVLSFTGYYIYDPFPIGGAGPVGDPGFTMGWMRFIHETCGFVFIAAILVRTYWAFLGNRYAHWRALIPITRAQWRDLLDMVSFYAFLRRHPPRANGHNPLAALAYLAIYFLFLLSILSGLGLFAWVSRIPTWRTLFGWTYTLLPIEQLRLLHFLLMFVFGAFTAFHVYCGVYAIQRLRTRREDTGQIELIEGGTAPPVAAALSGLLEAIEVELNGWEAPSWGGRF